MTGNGEEAEIQRLKVVVVGAQAVGKSSICEQLVRCTCPEEYEPTTRARSYYPAVLINDHLYDLRLVDCPPIRYFPANSLQEWTDYRGYCLRSASAYLLVYDVNEEWTFQYVKNIREQIVEQGIEVPVIIAANKMDLLATNGKKDKRDRESANIVKKQWKCVHIECSSKYNWHVSTVFKELMKAVDHHRDFGHKPTTARMQDALRRNQCTLL